MKPAISVENLGKCYRINHQAGPKGYRTLRESLAGMASARLRRFRNVGIDGASSEEFWALKDISFEVQPGEVLGIIGRNGAGKSTLLKILSRITKPTYGEVALRGRVGSLLEVGTGFHPELSGRENVFLNGSILGMSRNEIARQFDAIVDFSGVERFLDTPVKRYSSGMYVRLAFAVAAHLSSEILIVDEVLAVGDAEFQKKCLGKMQELAGHGSRTVLFVSHNVGTVQALCNNAILLSAGRILASGPVEDVVKQYTSAASEIGHTWTRSGQPAEVASIERIVVTNAAGRPMTEFPFDGDAVVTIDYRVNRFVSAMQVGVRVSTASGMVVGTTSNSDDVRGLAVPRDVGQHRERLRLPGRVLLPGRYTLLVALHTPRRTVYDRVDEAVTIDVSAVGYPYLDDARSGVVDLRCEWERMPALSIEQERVPL